MPSRRTPFLAPLALLLALTGSPANGANDAIDRQRELFVAAYPEVERGNWSVVEALAARDRRHLESYVLWPDLRAAYLRATLSRQSPATIEGFLAAHRTLRPARDLRYRYALSLARRGDHDRFLELYRSYYQGREIARLDCLALDAELKLGQTWRVAPRTEALWLVGHSQADECDPVFAWAKAAGHLPAKLYRERFELAVEARAFSRARWLGKSLGPEYVARAEAWQQAAGKPETLIRNAPRAADEEARARLVYAFERLTFRDPLEALSLWRGAKRKHPFAAAEIDQVERHIALWTARDGLPGAYELLARLSPAARNTEVMRWQARVALRNGDFARVLADIESMPPSEAKRDEWRYWRAVALEETGSNDAAATLFRELAAERSYYGFLAADTLDLNYAFGDELLEPDSAVLTELSRRQDLIRARELFLTGLDSRGRAEWDLAVNYLSDAHKLQAAILAQRWGWHSRAIATAASAGSYDDLSLRYPLPFVDEFAAAADAASIPKHWAYGIARSESIFMRDIRSGAGAVGLMQLMPATGRDVARQLAIRYEGLATLTDPVSNIRLGTGYLGRMSERFGGNRVLATAAYNAGPHRVDSWLPEQEPIETRIWIETIPFNETRAYVRRVLAAETIFRWRLTGETERVSALVGDILRPRLDRTVATLGGEPAGVERSETR